MLYTDEGEYKTALTYYFKAYKILTLKIGLSHQDTQRIYENMKSAYTKWKPEKNFERWIEEKMQDTN